MRHEKRKNLDFEKKIVQKKMNQRILVLMKDTVSFCKSCMLMVILCLSLF